jgi:hypothetical protein
VGASPLHLLCTLSADTFFQLISASGSAGAGLPRPPRSLPFTVICSPHSLHRVPLLTTTWACHAQRQRASTWEHRLGVCLLGRVKRAGLSRRMFPLGAHICSWVAGLNGARMQAHMIQASASDSAQHRRVDHQANVMTIRRLTASLVKTQRKSQNSPSLQASRTSSQEGQDSRGQIRGVLGVLRGPNQLVR